MPELPEVETMMRSLGDLSGLTFVSFDFFWPRQIEPTPEIFAERLLGATIKETTRRGKYICLLTDRGQVAIHPRMSGALLALPEAAATGKHTRIVAHLSAGKKLQFDDARKFGRWKYLPLGAELPGVGLDPFSPLFTPDWLFNTLKSQKKKPIKAVLLDQSLLAGLGNIYSDEALFRAKIHPERPAAAISLCECAALRAAIIPLLEEAIKLKGTSFDWAYGGGAMQNSLAVYGRKGKPCLFCGTILQDSKIGGRRSVFCPKCQA